MKTGIVARFKIAPWLIGVLLSTAAMFLGYTLGSDIARLLGGEPGIWARLGKGFVWGLLMAALQWPIVRAAGVPPLRFLVASAVAFAIGFPFGQAIEATMVTDWDLKEIWGYGSALATFALFLGIPQWWILRQHVHRAGLWILFSVIGWMLTGVAWIRFAVGSGEDAFAYGIVTGLGLVWLARSQSHKVVSQESIAETAKTS